MIEHTADELKALRQRVSELEALQQMNAQYREKTDRYIKDLLKIAEINMAISDDQAEILSRISQMISEVMRVPVVCLSEVRDNILYLLCCYDRGKISLVSTRIQIDLTPCSVVINTGDFSVCHGVADKFPDAAFLKDFRAYSYCGFPSKDASGNIVAITSLIDDRHHDFSLDDRNLLTIIAQKIGSIIERKWSGEKLKESEERYRSLVESTEDSIYLVDRDYKYVFMNKQHLSRLGFSQDHFIGHAYSEFHTDEETAEFVEMVDRVFGSGESIQHEHKSRRDNRYFLRTLSPVKDHNGKIIAVTVVSKNISVRKRMEEQLRALSFTDELTGLYNRRGFYALAEQQISVANRITKNLLLFSADVDSLKEINDTFGHQTGDMAIIEAANILKTTFRNSDIIARIGGDEFAGLFIENSDASPAMLSERLEARLRDLNEQEGRRYRISVSIGIIRCDCACHEALDQLLGRADNLMYENKREKRNLSSESHS